MNFLRIFLLFALFSVSLSHEPFNSHLLPRPLILEYPHESSEEIRLQCTSWRFGVEANNLAPWKTIPVECAEYVRDYMTGRAYQIDLERVANESAIYARNVELGADGNDVWVFDVDETLLSNLPYYVEHGYGLEVFDEMEFSKWVEKAKAPAIMSSLKLFEEIQSLGLKTFLLTGRRESHRSVTVDNLINAGFQNWDKLILRGPDDLGKQATVYKSERRSEMVKEGYRVVGNSGDQWSDILGSEMSLRSFKLPNPMYYIP